jgi:Tfp pilus assembly protein PilF
MASRTRRIRQGPVAETAARPDPVIAATPDAPSERAEREGWAFSAAALAVILVVTAIVYSSSFANGFLNWDDPDNVTQNLLIRSLSWPNVAAYFTTPLLGMYTPVVYISFALDYLAGGLNPFVYHLTNLALHLANVALVFFAILALSRSRVAAAVTAALFAVHPMNVAAVTPISVRSSLLYSCFYLAAWLAYIRHVQRGGRRWLWASFALFLLSALSKSAAVVFPLLMLATDWFSGRPISWKRIREKWPFLVAGAVFGVVTFVFREDTAGMQSVPAFVLWERLFFAAYTLVFYVAKLVVPVGLSAYYPYPARVNGHMPLVFFLSPLVVATVAWLAWRLRSYRRVLLFGGLIFIIHIFLVLKIVPIDDVIAADRYMYLPSIGLFLVAGEACRRWSRRAAMSVAALAGVLVVGLAVVSYGRSEAWQDNRRFYGEIIARYPTAAVAYSNRGASLIRDANDPRSALPDLDRAIQIDPNYAEARYNRATANMLIARPGAALADAVAAIRLKPGRSEYHLVSANARIALHDYRGAIDEANKVIALEPPADQLYMAYESRGIASVFLDDTAAAIRDFTTAISLEPGAPSLYQNRGNARAIAGESAGALADYDRAVELNPSLSTAYSYRGQLKVRMGDRSGGCDDLRRAAALGLGAARTLAGALCQ